MTRKKKRRKNKKRRVSQNVQRASTKRNRSKSSVSILQHISGNVKWYWGLFGVIAAILGFYINFIALGGIFGQNKLLDVDLAFFDIDPKGHLYLVDPDEIEIIVDSDDILNNRIEIPLNLAIRNSGDIPVDIVRIELKYPTHLEVVPQGQPKIDPNNQLLIYEHEVGLLENVSSFTPLQTIDILHIPHEFMTIPGVFLDENKIPKQLISIFGFEPASFQRSYFDITVYSKDRPPLNAQMVFTFTKTSNIFLSSSGSNITEAEMSKIDKEFFTLVAEGSLEPIEGSNIGLPQSDIYYEKLAHLGGVYQALEVEGILKSIIADADGDGKVEYELIDMSNDRIPDIKYSFDPPYNMLDWQGDIDESVIRESIQFTKSASFR